MLSNDTFIVPTNMLLFSGRVFVKNSLSNLERLIKGFAVVNLLFTENIMQGTYESFIAKFFKIPVINDFRRKFAKVYF